MIARGNLVIAIAIISCRGRVDVSQAQRWHIAPARSEAELEQLEAAYRVLDLYIWLSFRLEDAFTGAQAPCTTLCSKGLDASCMCMYTPKLLQKWDGDLPAQKLHHDMCPIAAGRIEAERLRAMVASLIEEGLQALALRGRPMTKKYEPSPEHDTCHMPRITLLGATSCLSAVASLVHQAPLCA